jgi:hypothetical protein
VAIGSLEYLLCAIVSAKLIPSFLIRPWQPDRVLALILFFRGHFGIDNVVNL